MALQVNDADVEAALKRLAETGVVALFPKQRVATPDGHVTRGSPGVVRRGGTMVCLPGESTPRELEEYEVEGLVELARAGEIKLAEIVAPRLSGQPERLPVFVFEDGSRLGQGDAGYPTQAFSY